MCLVHTHWQYYVCCCNGWGFSSKKPHNPLCKSSQSFAIKRLCLCAQMLYISGTFLRQPTMSFLPLWIRSLMFCSYTCHARLSADFFNVEFGAGRMKCIEHAFFFLVDLVFISSGTASTFLSSTAVYFVRAV
jgi:hypothetical protein